MQCHYVREVHNLISHRKCSRGGIAACAADLSHPSQAIQSLLPRTHLWFCPLLDRCHCVPFSGETWTRVYPPQRGHQQQTKEIVIPKSNLVTDSGLIGCVKRSIIEELLPCNGNNSCKLRSCSSLHYLKQSADLRPPLPLNCHFP